MLRPGVVIESCEICRRPKAVCVCDRIVSYPTSLRLVILQHPQEQDALLGSAQILVASLPKVQVVIGLSWRSLGHAMGEDVDVSKWAVLFPERDGRSGVREASALEGIVVLDGTWSKAKTLWWRNPWLNRMNRLTLKPKQPSIYGKLRAEPKREYVSTLESVALALTLCGESPEIEAGLYRVFRTLVQRVRDADVPKEARKLPRRTRPPRVPKPVKEP